MSAFCVFGVSRLDCKKAAEKKVRAVDPDTKKRLSPDEWRAKVDALSVAMFDEMVALRQISPAFDAPQFCYDWIDVAAMGGQVKLTRLMVRGPKTDKTGVEVKRDGQAVITWLPYQKSAQEAVAA